MEVLFPDSGWVLMSAKIDSANIGYGAIIDITERKEYQSKTESQAQLLNESNDAIFVIDEKTKIVFWAKGAENVYGWSEHEVLHKEIGPLLFPTEKMDVLTIALEETIHYGEWVGECANLTKDGNEILLDCHWKQVTLLYGKEKFTMMINSDITEKRQMELHSLRAQKLETVALLTSSISHVLQNILAPIRISVGMLKSEPNNPNNTLILDAVEKSAQSGLDLLQKILAFGKGIKGEKIPIEVNSIVKDTLENFQMINGDTIKIERHLHSQKQHILGDEQQLRQVLFNLFTNAKDALQDEGTLTVSIQHPGDGLEIVQENPQFEPEKYIDISIKDNGIGITDEDMKRIFDPFFTTKKDNHGTGLGLAIVQNIIRNHGGVLTVESQYNSGTTFHIILPLLSRGE
jgi:PAS domain S-box-containing protein